MFCSDKIHFRADVRYNPKSTEWYHFDPYGFPTARILPLVGDCPVASGGEPNFDGVVHEHAGAREWFEGNTRAEVTTVVYVLQQLDRADLNQAN